MFRLFRRALRFTVGVASLAVNFSIFRVYEIVPKPTHFFFGLKFQTTAYEGLVHPLSFSPWRVDVFMEMWKPNFSTALS